MKYLSEYTEDAQTKLFKQTRSFFAFSNRQFNESKKEGVKYVSLGAGLICPVDTVDILITGLDDIQKNAITQDVEENGADKIIEREYFNYESQITMDTSDAEGALSDHIKQYPELFTKERINKVFNNCFELAVTNDWF